MKRSELASGELDSTQMCEHLAAGNTTAITTRISEYLKAIAAKKTSLNELSFSSYVRTCLLSDLPSFEHRPNR